MDASSILTYREAEKFVEEKTAEIDKLSQYVTTIGLEFKRELCIAWKQQSQVLMKEIDAGINSYKLLRIKSKTVTNIAAILKELKKRSIGLYNSFDEMLKTSIKVTSDTNRENSDKKYNVIDEIDWIFANIGNITITEEDSPTPGAYHYLLKIQENDDMMKDFYKMYMGRRMPSREEIDDILRREGETSDEDLMYIQKKLDQALKERINI